MENERRYNRGVRRRAETEPRSDEGAGQSRLYDAQGRVTTDPARAVSGEVLELDQHRRLSQRSWFRIEWIELKWLPVSEPAFLLWVLAAFVVVWVVVAIWLKVF
jgi:hypothetical protein